MIELATTAGTSFEATTPPRGETQFGAAAAAALLVEGGAIYLARAFGVRQSLLFCVGVAAGVVLNHTAFGFTSSWRRFITAGRGDGLRAQMLMLMVTCAVFFPLLRHGHIFGQTVRGAVSPLSVSVVVGAFLFGAGMQLGGGCASGTLYAAGGGNTRMLLTLAAFIAGSVIGTVHAASRSSVSCRDRAVNADECRRRPTARATPETAAR